MGEQKAYAIILLSKTWGLLNLRVKSIATNIRTWQRRLLDTVVSHNPKLGLEERAEGFVSMFEDQLPPRSHILDIGGGWGFYAKPLASRKHHVTVLDVVKPRFQKAPVVVYQGKRIPFADKSFDVSLFITVLHHISDPVAVIREAHRVTRKTLIVVEDLYHHALGRWWTILRDQMYNFEFFGHPCQFKKAEEWVDLFEGLGFTLIEQKKVYTRLAGLRILNGVFVFQVQDGQ